MKSLASLENNASLWRMEPCAPHCASPQGMHEVCVETKRYTDRQVNIQDTQIIKNTDNNKKNFILKYTQTDK